MFSQNCIKLKFLSCSGRPHPLTTEPISHHMTQDQSQWELCSLKYGFLIHHTAGPSLPTLSSACNTLFFHSSIILCASFKTNTIYGISKHHFWLLPLGFHSSLNHSIHWQLPPALELGIHTCLFVFLLDYELFESQELSFISGEPVLNTESGLIIDP